MIITRAIPSSCASIEHLWLDSGHNPRGASGARRQRKQSLVLNGCLASVITHTSRSKPISFVSFNVCKSRQCWTTARQRNGQRKQSNLHGRRSLHSNIGSRHQRRQRKGHVHVVQDRCAQPLYNIKTATKARDEVHQQRSERQPEQPPEVGTLLKGGDSDRHARAYVLKAVSLNHKLRTLAPIWIHIPRGSSPPGARNPSPRSPLITGVPSGTKLRGGCRNLALFT